MCLFISYVVVLLGVLPLGYPACEILASTNFLITSYRYNMRLNYLNDCRGAHRLCLRRRILVLIVSRLLGEPYAIVGNRHEEYVVSQFRPFIYVTIIMTILYMNNVGRKTGLYEIATRAVYVKVLSTVVKGTPCSYRLLRDRKMRCWEFATSRVLGARLRGRTVSRHHHSSDAP